MSTVVFRDSPSGPLAPALSDMLCPPASVLGRALGATPAGPSQAVAIDGAALGGIVRFDGVYELPLSAGQHDNVPIPDGVRNVEITPVGGDVTISGFQVLGRGNVNSTGLNITLRGTAGILIFLNGSTSSTNGNRISGTSNISFEMTEDGDCIFFARVEGGLGRWQPVARVIRPGAIRPEPLGNAGVPIYARRGFSATGAAADDILLGASPSLSTMVAYEVLLLISTAVGASTAVLRDQPGGAGSALSSSLSMGATGTVRNNATTITSVPTGSLFYLRRSNGNTAGTVIVFFRALNT